MSQPLPSHGSSQASRTASCPPQDTIRSFREILSGAHDNLPESALYMVGTIEDVKAKAEQLAKEMGESS